MMHRHQFLGHVVRTLRRMAMDGKSPSEMMEYVEHLRAQADAHWLRPYDYLTHAFLERNFKYVFPRGPMDDDLSIRFVQMAFERRDEWKRQPIPELMRLRDYFAFSRFAKEENVIVTVCHSNPASGPFVGRPGFRCFAGELPAVTSRTGPCAGLVAADPADPRLKRILDSTGPRPILHAEYAEALRERGYAVRGAEDGFVVEGSGGQRFYEGYRLHGVHDVDSGEPVWSGSGGERLRGSLNRLLGEELVRSGPHDQWEHRNDPAIPQALRGPQLPVIQFEPDQTIISHLEVDDLAEERHYQDRWAQLYPEPPDPEAAAQGASSDPESGS